ncbi:Structural polyprotein, partial [Bienertia sinuspersici]
ESENPILIKCFNCEASRRSCYGVLSPVGYVDSQYVAATAALNTRTWYKKYDSKCTRMMCDPSIAVRLFLLRLRNTNSLPSLQRRLIVTFITLTRLIFFPVVIQEHWICLLFAVKEQMIWAIDSLFLDLLSQHQDAINKLVT